MIAAAVDQRRFIYGSLAAAIGGAPREECHPPQGECGFPQARQRCGGAGLFTSRATGTVGTWCYRPGMPMSRKPVFVLGCSLGALVVLAAACNGQVTPADIELNAQPDAEPIADAGASTTPDARDALVDACPPGPPGILPDTDWAVCGCPFNGISLVACRHDDGRITCRNSKSNYWCGPCGDGCPLSDAGEPQWCNPYLPQAPTAPCLPMCPDSEPLKPRFRCAVDGSSECAELGTNPAHCGACNKACAPGESCSEGKCRP